jgi:hypothetical protein
MKQVMSDMTPIFTMVPISPLVTRFYYWMLSVPRPTAYQLQQAGTDLNSASDSPIINYNYRGSVVKKSLWAIAGFIIVCNQCLRGISGSVCLGWNTSFFGLSKS